MKLRLRVNSPLGSGFIVECDKPVVRIGRDPGCELSFNGTDSQGVSWNHARLELTPSAAFLSDMESSNGTFLNDHQVENQAEVQAGDLIRLGLRGPKVEVMELELPRASASSSRHRAHKHAPTVPEPVVALPPPPGCPAPAPRKTGRKLLIGGGLFALCLVLAGAAFWLTNRNPVREVAKLLGGSGLSGDSAPATAGGTEVLAQKALDIIKKNCAECHGVKKTRNLDLFDRDELLAQRKQGDKSYVILQPGKPDASVLWKRVGVDKDMPDGSSLPSEEQEILKQWVLAGAPFPPGLTSPGRTFRSDGDILTAIRDHLRGLSAEQRKEQRYFTLTHLHNDRKVSDRDLRFHRAALAKLLNSLTWKTGLVVPRAIDQDQTVYTVDLRDLDLHKDDRWRRILESYPYGVRHDQRGDADKRKVAEEVYKLSGTTLPSIRADWFIATASRPPLYHDLLGLPRDASTLEQTLQVNVQADFLNNKMARAGILTSGVSRQNRAVERHPSRYGAYWKSYDFRSNEGTGNLVRYPLGPRFPRNPFADKAFKHDGGEMVFNLPNGLQAYFLVNGDDKRIDEGPIDVVYDNERISGSPAIVTGLSCMACHKHGIRDFKDEIRASNAIVGPTKDKVERLYPNQQEMNGLLAGDTARFLQALAVVAGPFLKAGEDRSKDLRDFEEPIGICARTFLSKELNLTTAALEVGLPPGEAGKLKTVIEANSTLRETLGLDPLVQGGVIKRAVWESLKDSGGSPFQRAAQELNLGQPAREQPAYPTDLPPP